MKKRQSGEWGRKLVLGLLLSAVPATAWADWVDVMRKFRPRISVQEEYTDNLFYRKDNRVDDFITTVSPGIGFSSTENKEVKYGLDLDYAPGFVFYAHNSNRNYVSHAGTLNAWYTVGRNWTFRLWDSLIQSKNPLEGYVVPPQQQPQAPGLYYPGVSQNGYRYLRNIVQPSLAYRFGREDMIELSYVNNYYHSENPGVGTIVLDSVTPRFTYWFNIHHGVVLEYTYTTGRYDFSPDFAGHRARGRYSFRPDPQTTLFVQYVYDAMDYDNPGIDYHVHSPSAGITYAFSPTLSGRLQGGYFWRDPERGKRTSGPTAELGLTQRTMRTTLDLSLNGGYSADLSSGQSLGFYQYYRAAASLSYQFTSRMSAGVLGSVGRYDYVERGYKTWIWRTEATFSFQPLRWLTASLVVYHQEDDPDQSAGGYRENRAMIRLSAVYW